MVIDKKLNLDTELEYLPDGSLSFAQNVVVSQDGLTIQNEPAIVNFLNNENFDLVGFIACNEEFVLFGKDNRIVRVNKNGYWNPCNTNWHYQGGEVFGTFSYNVANELIIAISERYPKTDCPLKIINLDRDKYLENSDDNIYTLTPNIPKSNIVNIEYTLGNKIKKGKYNFFIKYYIGNNFETAWFPIGVPVFVYDNISASEAKVIDNEVIQATGDFGEHGIPTAVEEYKILYEDFYNEDNEYTNNNVKLTLEIKDKINYTHYQIGYIINSNTVIEGRKANKNILNPKTDNFVINITDYSEPVSVDELTVGTFNIYNVNTMCNYKDRLYLANYKEENRNIKVPDIDVTNIRVLYNVNDVSDINNKSRIGEDPDDDTESPIHPEFNPEGGGGGITNDDNINQADYSARKREWVSKPGRCAVYNFFIHYVYPNGNFTDGIKIGKYTGTDNSIIPENMAELETFVNSKGDVLFKTPITEFHAKKLYFTGIKMYPEFVGYFISYEKPEYIQVGEGLMVPSKVAKLDGLDYDLFNSEYTASSVYKFYYPEFNIVGGKTNINRLIHSGTHTIANTKIDVNNTSKSKGAVGYILSKNDFVGDILSPKVKNATIVSPNSYENIGREGYLRLNFDSDVILASNKTEKFYSYTGIQETTDIYLADDKRLVSLGYIKYVDYSTDDAINTYGYENVPYNYDFYRCFSSIIFFKNNGIIINQTESNHINATSGENYYPEDEPEDKLYPHIGIIKYWHETHYPLFLKEINESPEIIFYSQYKIKIKVEGESILEEALNSEQYQKKSLIISPDSVNNLYKLSPVYYDYTGKLLVNYDEKLISNKLEEYKQTIRRSDVIQSESIVNSWKFFRPENYKIITEDKGAINNIVGIGNYLFAHCEHSLFLFDITNSLQALDKNVQLLQPDSFEVAYKEVFTADKGYGGLQDYVSWICDEFGYIFFDKSAKKIYRYDGGQLKDMTEGISNLIKVVNPEEIWFGNDRERNRIMVNIRGIDDNLIFSYNLFANGWTSTHSYIANYKFIGIKDKLFIPNVVGNNLTITHYIDTEFNKFSLPVGNIDNDNSFKSFIDVVFTNPNYNKIKVLDFITYILNKEPADNFELLQLEIFTNCCYSGVIDISQERKKVSDYKKPYYDFERWNFNYFRNVIDKIENGDMVDRLSGRIYSYPQKVQRGYDNALMSGKYVVIRFSFKLMSKQVNIKDIQAYFKP